MTIQQSYVILELNSYFGRMFKMKTTRLLSTALASVILFSPAAGAVKPDSCSDAEEPTIKRARICEDTLDESTSDESTSDESTSDESTSDESTSDESTSDIETPEDIPIPEIKSDYEHDNFVKAIKKQNREDNRNHTYARRPSGWKPAIEELPTGERVDNWLMSTCGEDYNYAFTFDFKPFLPFNPDLDMLRMRAWFMYYYKRGKYDLPQWVIDLKKEQDKETSSTTSTTACEETGEPESVNQEDDDGTPKATCEMSAESEQSHSHTASLGHVLEMSSDQETYSLTAPKHTSEATFEGCAELVEKKKHTEDLESGSSPFYEPKIPAIENTYAHDSFTEAISKTNLDDDRRHAYRRRTKDWKPTIEELPTGKMVDDWLKEAYSGEYNCAFASISKPFERFDPSFDMPRLRAWFMYYYQRGKYELPQWVVNLKKEQDEENALRKSNYFYEPEIPAIGNYYALASFTNAIFRTNLDDDREYAYRRRPKDWKPAIEELPTGEVVDRWLEHSDCGRKYNTVIAFTSFYGADADPHNPELYMPRMRAWFMYYYKRGKYELPQWVIDLKNQQDKEQAAKKERMQALDLLAYLATTQDNMSIKK